MLIIGTGDAFSAERYGCCALLETASGHVLIDCPDSIHRALRDARDSSGWNVDAHTIQDIIITHLHGDHCNGLESIGFTRWLAHRQDGKPLPRLHCWAPVAERLWERLAPAMDQGGNATLRDYFDVHTLDPADLVRLLAARCRATGKVTLLTGTAARRLLRDAAG
jgi:ribonuclease BN (tRNA processing enzyme)